MSISNAPLDSDFEIVITRKRKRVRGHAIDPYLGYYMRSSQPAAPPTPPQARHSAAVNRPSPKTLTPTGVVKTSAYAEDEDTRHSTITIPNDQFALTQDDAHGLEPTATAQANQVTVEAFLQWSAATKSSPDKSSRKKRKYAHLLVDDDQSDNVFKRSTHPLVRRYKRRRRNAPTSSPAYCDPHPTSKPKVARRVKRQARVQCQDEPTRRPLQLLSASLQTPPSSPTPKKWRLLNPHVASRATLASLQECQRQLQGDRPKEKRFSKWLPYATPGLQNHVTLKRVFDHDQSGLGARPLTNRLNFVPLEEHEERFAAVFRGPCAAEVKDASPPRNEELGDITEPVFGQLDLGDPSASPLLVDDQRPDATLRAPADCARSASPQSVAVTNPAPLGLHVHPPPAKFITSKRSQLIATTEILPLSRHASQVPVTASKPARPTDSSMTSSPDRSLQVASFEPVNLEASKTLKPIGSFLDGFREIARIATQMHTKIADGADSHDDELPRHGEGDTASSARRSLVEGLAHLAQSAEQVSRPRPSRSIAIPPKDPRRLRPLADKKKPRPRYTLSNLRPSSQVIPLLPQELQPSSSPINQWSHTPAVQRTNEVKTPDYDIRAALRPQTSQVVLDVPSYSSHQTLSSLGFELFTENDDDAFAF
ncbi:hypothetical protein EIP91_002950 [Steccherinum ochraceum]|uniref:Uncharacterized protein n=1 Tax=Steccherinum ochraceum TaxID=92696 RepID=A0A4R0RCZ4_9APHY|nr:hypothetical protein EIP91_002950 [Steccherinum ochraceum]